MIYLIYTIQKNRDLSDVSKGFEKTRRFQVIRRGVICGFTYSIPVRSPTSLDYSSLRVRRSSKAHGLGRVGSGQEVFEVSKVGSNRVGIGDPTRFARV